MTALSGGPPSRGVRYVFTLGEHDEAHAVYDVAVFTSDREGRATVRVEATGAAFAAEPVGVEAPHAQQALALAKTLSRRGEDGVWPRRVERWRSPGVR